MSAEWAKGGPDVAVRAVATAVAAGRLPQGLLKELPA